MLRKSSAVLALAVLLGFVSDASAQPPPVSTGVVLNATTTSKVGNMPPYWTFTSTGKIGIAKEDNFAAFTLSFVGPDGSTPTVTIVSFKAPDPGTITTFEFLSGSTKTGKWTTNAVLSYYPGGKMMPKTTGDYNEFTVN